MSEEPTKRFNLLGEPLIRVRIGPIEQAMSFPEILEALGQEDDVHFPALRPHQSHAWHAFLAQLAAMALHEAGEADSIQNAVQWAKHLIRLTDGEDEAWHLVVDDVSRPAFMQPPVPEGQVDHKIWKRIPTPGNLDVLVTSRNHDVKARLISEAEIDHWVFALISLQTMEGYLGAGNFGIARMNGGFASRPGIAVSPNPSWAVRFRRDVSVLLKRRSILTDDPWPYPSSGGRSLLWVLPWDGRESLSLADFDPFFIEVCRRVRLELIDGKLVAFGISTKVPRINAKENRGVTGDPWTPITQDDEGLKALTVGPSGFNYRLLQRLLFSGDYQHAICWRQEDETGDLFLIATALSRGQGRTEGLHHREMVIPATASRLMASAQGNDRLAQLSRRRIQVADTVQRKVLHIALCSVLQGAPEGENALNLRDPGTERWLSNLDHEIDGIFFQRLFSQLEMNDDDAADTWARELIGIAGKQLDHALRATPQPSVRRYRVDTAARGLLYGLSRKHFPDLYDRTKEGVAHA